MNVPLTIAIPTYNRNEILAENLSLLLPQMGPQCGLLILDNASPRPVEETLAPLLAQYPDARVEIVRHPHNIGANANILRCFEVCRTDWIWALSDDDTPRPDAVEIILEAIESRPECLLFNFSSGFFNRTQTIWTRGVRGLAEGVDSFGNVLFLSSSVHRTRAAQKHLNVGYAYLHSQPNFVPTFSELGEDGLCCLSHRQIVTWNEPSDEQQWPFVNFALGIMAFLELPMPPHVRRRFARKVVATIPSIESFVIQLLLGAVKDHDRRGALYLYDQICFRLYYFEGLKMKLKIRLLRLMLQYPHLGFKALQFHKKRKGTAQSETALQDRFSRL